MSTQQPDHFIPVSTDVLLADFCSADKNAGSMKADLQRLFQLILASVHMQFHQRSQKLLQSYRPFNPDREVVLNDVEPTTDKRVDFLQQTQQILIDANYQQLDAEMLAQAMQLTSPYGVEISVDLDDFDELLLFYRGSEERIDYRRSWQSLFLKKRKIITPHFRRLFLLISLKADAVCAGDLCENGVRPVYSKLFKDIPYSDLEMLFPNSKVKMRLFDKIKIGITGGGGAVGGVVATVTKLSAAVSASSILFTLLGLAGILWRQVAKVFSQRTRYMAQLSSNLYFHNMDNNAGALSYLLTMAEEEECKEMLLAYAMLNEVNSKGMTLQQLDEACEAYLLKQYHVVADFEVQDAVDKLKQFGLLVEQGSRLVVIDPVTGFQRLDKRWDMLFA